MATKMDTRRIAYLYRELEIAYRRTEYLSFSFNDGVQVTEQGLLEIAPVEQWDIEERACETEYPLQASCTKHGVKWFTVMTHSELEAIKQEGGD